MHHKKVLVFKNCDLEKAQFFTSFKTQIVGVFKRGKLINPRREFVNKSKINKSFQESFYEKKKKKHFDNFFNFS